MRLRLAVVTRFGGSLPSAFLCFLKLVLIDFLAVSSKPDEVVPRPVLPLRVSTHNQLRVLLKSTLILFSWPTKADEVRIPSKADEAGWFFGHGAVVVFFVGSEKGDEVFCGEGEGLRAAEAEKTVSSACRTLECFPEVSGWWFRRIWSTKPVHKAERVFKQIPEKYLY